jgi:hypothetical protein
MLSENLILSKSKVDRLSAVKNLNLWGAELTDVSIVAQLVNVEVLALSVNHVSTLRDIAECKQLRELYLRKNDVASLGEVYYLTKLPNLTTLWLSDNPCARDPNYRLFTVRCCPNLKQLDSIEVTPQERNDAQSLSAAVINEIVATRLGPAPPPATPTPARDVAPKPSVPSTPPHEYRGEGGERMGMATPAPAYPGAPVQASRQTQRNIMTAIMALVAELTPDSMDILYRELGERLKRR